MSDGHKIDEEYPNTLRFSSIAKWEDVEGMRK